MTYLLEATSGAGGVMYLAGSTLVVMRDHRAEST